MEETIQDTNVRCRALLASYGEILQNCDSTSRQAVQEVMKHIVKQTRTYIHTMYVKDLHKDLLKRKIPTKTVDCLAKRMCTRLQQKQKQKQTAPS